MKLSTYFFIIYMLHICSFNCHSFKNSLNAITSLCDNYDIVFLQETWLAKFELPLLNQTHKDFLGCGISAFNSSDSLLCGRPFGGLGVLWKKSLQSSIKVLCVSERIMQINLMTTVGHVSLFNVYLPTDYRCADSLDKFCMCLGQLNSLVDMAFSTSACVGILGDCNANSHGSTFFTELQSFVEDKGLVISDVQIMGGISNTYTFVSAAHGTTSWLDHFICSPVLHSTISSISVRYDVSMYDHMPLTIKLNVAPETCVVVKHCINRPARPRWETATVNDIAEYNNTIRASLETSCMAQLRELHVDCLAGCGVDSHVDTIYRCYGALTAAITDSANHSIRKSHVTRGGRPTIVMGWNDSVKMKHLLARESFLSWRAGGSPRGGHLASQMRLTRLSFKYALRACKRAQKRSKASKLALSLLTEPASQFWSWVNRELGGRCPLPPSIGGLTGDAAIADMWMKHFQKMFNDPSCSSNMDVLDQLQQAPVARVPPITTDDALRAICRLKSGKASGEDHLATDHLLHLQPEAVACIAVVFDSMMNHTSLPDDLIHSTLVPLVKDKSGMLDDVSNYRAIALSTSLSKVLELILVERIGKFLHTNDAQFGFKSNLSTTHATFALKEAVNHYTSQGSPVYACFLDASKAFDRVCHSKLFKLLAARGVPQPYLKLLLIWYRAQRMTVKWSNSMSVPFSVQNGVRQGSNLSPMLFSVYIDELLHVIQQSKTGCHIGQTAVNIIAYADDLVILSPTRTGLQRLVHMCESFALKQDIVFNVKKTVCMCFHPQRPYYPTHLTNSSAPCILLNDQQLTWVDEFKYLGHVVRCDMRDIGDMKRVKRSMYYSANMLCAKLGYADRPVLLQLFRAHCMHVYGCELWNVAREKRVFKEVCVAYHSCIKKLLQLPRWVRNHELCHDVKILPCHMLVASRQLCFWKRLNSSENHIIMCTLKASRGNGLLATNHCQLRQDYGILQLNLASTGKSAIQNMFRAFLNRVVAERQLEAALE